MGTDLKFHSLKEFYPYYLTEHSKKSTRTLHFIGTALLFVLIAIAIVLGNYSLLWALPLIGYGFAWVGHYFFEKNRPATFQYPLYSLASDFIMFWHILTGQIDKKLKEAHAKFK